MQILEGELNIKASIKPNLAEISHKKRKITKRKILDNVINNLCFFICFYTPPFVIKKIILSAR